MSLSRSARQSGTTKTVTPLQQDNFAPPAEERACAKGECCTILQTGFCISGKVWRLIKQPAIYNGYRRLTQSLGTSRGCGGKHIPCQIVGHSSELYTLGFAASLLYLAPLCPPGLRESTTVVCRQHLQTRCRAHQLDAPCRDLLRRAVPCRAI